MLARVVTIQVRPEKMDECISIFRERNAPSIASQEVGFARLRTNYAHGQLKKREKQAVLASYLIARNSLVRERSCVQSTPAAPANPP